MKAQKVTTNKEQELYVIPCGTGYSCLGFDVLIKRRNALANELGRTDLTKEKRGTLKAYVEYMKLLNIGEKKHHDTGWRSASELKAELIGLEGKRVEITNERGEKRRFIVGKSTGWIPCHLEIPRRDSTGGVAVYGEIQTIKIIK